MSVQLSDGGTHAEQGINVQVILYSVVFFLRHRRGGRRGCTRGRGVGAKLALGASEKRLGDFAGVQCRSDGDGGGQCLVRRGGHAEAATDGARDRGMFGENVLQRGDAFGDGLLASVRRRRGKVVEHLEERAQGRARRLGHIDLARDGADEPRVPGIHCV